MSARCPLRRRRRRRRRLLVKLFEGEDYVGEVVGWLPATAKDAALWRVVYEDSDEEDLGEAEVRAAVADYDAGRRGAGRSAAARARRRAAAWRARGAGR